MAKYDKFELWARSYLKACGIDEQAADVEMEFDTTLTMSENKQIFKAKYPAPTADLTLSQIKLDEAKAEVAKKADDERYLAESRRLSDEKLASMAKNMPKNDLSKHTKTIRSLVNAVADGHAPALFIVSPDVGIGKTHEVLSLMGERAWKMDEDYAYFSGYCTPLSLYDFFWESRDKKLIILDDIDQAYHNPIVLSLLKNATFGIPERRVAYKTTSKNREAPAEFVVNAGIVFIANRIPENALTRALMSRSLYLEINMTNAEKQSMLSRFAEIPFKNTTMEQRKEALQFVRDHHPAAMREVSFRLLQKIYNLILSNPSGWRETAKEIMAYDEDILAFMQADKEDTTHNSVAKFTELTGLSRATFFRIKKRFEFQEYGKSLISQFADESDISEVKVPQEAAFQAEMPAENDWEMYWDGGIL